MNKKKLCRCCPEYINLAAVSLSNLISKDMKNEDIVLLSLFLLLSEIL